MDSHSDSVDDHVTSKDAENIRREPFLKVEGDEFAEIFENEMEEDLPPILEPPSTGYFHTVDENQPPPELQREHNGEHYISCEDEDGDTDDKEKELVEIDDSGSEKSSTTDSDDELVGVDYEENLPKKYKRLLERYGFLTSKETWVYNIRSFYKKQPSRIRRLLKMHKDVDGNPVEEPVELLFEKIHAERESMRKAQNIKNEFSGEEGENKDEEVASVVSVQLASSDPRLVHVAYPGNVVNNEKAVATLGGAGTISKVFEQPNKKLTLRLRPNDPYANGVNAQGRTMCGLLLRVRRRKDKPVDETPKDSHCNFSGAGTILDSLGTEPLSTDLVQDMLLDNQLHLQSSPQVDNAVSVNEKVYRPQDVLSADKLITEEIVKKEKLVKAWGLGQSKDFNLKIPKMIETKPDPCRVTTVGIVHRSYDFNGIYDFQYLPISKKPDESLTSIKDKIFPIFGTSDNPEKLVMKELINEEVRCQTFSLPPSLSRIDNPPRGLIDELIVSEKSDTSARQLPPDDSVFSSRRKRIIFTISYNFQADARSPDSQVDVPSQPLDLAAEDIERRQIKKDLIDLVRKKFEERPIWSKAALEFVTKIPSQTLKYIIPNFAYFGANGPWRNTWIKFGVDPRKHPRYVMFQAVDFRVPFIYRRFMNITPHNPEANHKFLPEHVPPKTQMFYQLCDIVLDEIKELIGTLKKKAETGGLVYDEKFGFLKEGTYEYFRYILTHYLENLLQEHGKIPVSTDPAGDVSIPPGDIEPNIKLKAAPHRRVRVKRIRKSTRKVVDPSVVPKQNKGLKGRGKKVTSTSRSYQEALEDLALNDLPAQPGSNEDDDFYDDDDDYLDD